MLFDELSHVEFRVWIRIYEQELDNLHACCGLRFVTESSHTWLTTTEHAMDRRIDAAIKIIQDEIHQNIPVGELARQVRLSTGHFIRLFKAETSLSPKQYVRCVRMKRAAVLLNDSFLSIKEIAANLGAGDRSHFSRDFKKSHGRTPSSFRERDDDSSTNDDDSSTNTE